MSNSTLCLNCETKIIGKFCFNCGQKTDTHRINFKHFIFHDILHGVWHVEKGILFTLKEALIRPGKAALDYISGKRIRYYNVFYFILLLIGINLFIGHYRHELFETGKEIASIGQGDVNGKLFYDFLSIYAKLLLFSIVPCFALNSFVLFKKSKLNYSEHSILAGMVFLVILFFTAISQLLYFFELTNNFNFISDFGNIATPITILVYIIFGYYQAFHSNYKILGMILRIIIFFSFCFLELIIFFLLIFGIITNWKFGALHLA